MPDPRPVPFPNTPGSTPSSTKKEKLGKSKPFGGGSKPTASRGDDAGVNKGGKKTVVKPSGNG